MTTLPDYSLLRLLYTKNIFVVVVNDSIVFVASEKVFLRDVDAAAESDRWQTRGVEGDSQLTLPLLMRNKIPEGYETDDKLDVALRPDEVSWL